MLFYEEKPSIDFSRSTAIPPRPLQNGIVFEDVSFQYPGNEKPTLNHLSFRLDKGMRFALVGNTVCGGIGEPVKGSQMPCIQLRYADSYC